MSHMDHDRSGRQGASLACALRRSVKWAVALGAWVLFGGCGDLGRPAQVVDELGEPASIDVVSPTLPLQIGVGETVTLQADVRDASGKILGDEAVQWFSSDPAVVEVDMVGVASGRAVGIATLRASLESIQSADLAITVVATVGAVATVSTIPTGPIEVSEGATVQFGAEVRDAQGTLVASAALSWSSTDATVVTIDAAGLATANGVGSAQVLAESEGIQSAPVDVSVTSVAPDFDMLIQPIFTTSCGFSGCHGGPNPQEELNLEPGQAYDEIVNVSSTRLPQWLLVQPGDPDASLLYVKVASDAPPDGARMPLGGSLTAVEIQRLRDWIAAGAPR